MLVPCRFRSGCVCAVLIAGLVCAVVTDVRGGEVRLKNGTLLEGKPVPIQGLTTTHIQQSNSGTTSYPILLVDTGLQRYFVPKRQIDEINPGAGQGRLESFTLPQKASSRKQMVTSLGGFEATPFDEFGRRRVTVATPRGPLHIVQGVTEITPHHVTVSSLTHVWEHGLALSSLPPKMVDAWLRRATDQTNPDDRLAIARFYLQAGLYEQGAAEVTAIIRDFPELKAATEEVLVQLRQLRARQLLAEVQRRRQAGQHRLASAATQVFPVENVSAAVLRDVRQITADYEQARNQAEHALALLGELQGQLDDPKKQMAVAPLRSKIAQELDYETLGRLDPFLKLESDDTLSPEEKLGLAYTGWVLGGSHADTDFDLAVRLWHARFLILEFLRSDDPRRRTELLAELIGVEGIAAERLVRMVPLLPPPLESADIDPGRPQRIEFAGPDGPIAYWVLLPEEYNRHHTYPLIVTLRAAERTAEEMLAWWGLSGDGRPGQSQRRGYIVIAPEYLDEKARTYDYGTAAHQAVVQSIRHARKRFPIDSDRVFLSGHGAGGDAAFDMGMSRPDLFAGVIPIAGISDKICRWYRPNAKEVAWYVVAGELDRDSLARNASDLSYMMTHGYDIIYTEYLGRGYESYYEEIHKLFDWMDRQRRTRYLEEIEMKVLRPSDDRFYWLEAAGFPANVTESTVLLDEGQRQRIAPVTLFARVSPGNSITVRSGAERHTLWLSPEFIDFEKRVIVRIGARQRFNDFLRPDLETMLEDLRTRGDRQMLYWLKLEL